MSPYVTDLGDPVHRLRLCGDHHGRRPGLGSPQLRWGLQRGAGLPCRGSSGELREWIWFNAGDAYFLFIQSLISCLKLMFEGRRRDKRTMTAFEIPALWEIRKCDFQGLRIRSSAFTLGASLVCEGL